MSATQVSALVRWPAIWPTASGQDMVAGMVLSPQMKMLFQQETRSAIKQTSNSGPCRKGGLLAPRGGHAAVWSTMTYRYKYSFASVARSPQSRRGENPALR